MQHNGMADDVSTVFSLCHLCLFILWSESATGKKELVRMRSRTDVKRQLSKQISKVESEPPSRQSVTEMTHLISDEKMEKGGVRKWATPTLHIYCACACHTNCMHLLLTYITHVYLLHTCTYYTHALITHIHLSHMSVLLHTMHNQYS